MDSKNFAIGVLSTTAVILLVGLVVINSRPAPALAEMSIAKGDYIVTVANGPQLDEEFVYVLDVPEQKLIVYRFNTPRQQVDIVQGLDLTDIRKDAANTQPRTRRRP